MSRVTDLARMIETLGGCLRGIQLSHEEMTELQDALGDLALQIARAIPPKPIIVPSLPDGLKRLL